LPGFFYRMLSRNQLKLLTSLHLQKYRQELGVFPVEGVKMVNELLASNFEIQGIYATAEWINSPYATSVDPNTTLTVINDQELQKISNLNAPNQVVAIARMKSPEPFRVLHNEWILALDQIRDPGNLGTIIRTADWFGINRIVASYGTADLYNPKVVQASMGSVFRVPVHYAPLREFLAGCNADMPVFGAFLDGQKIQDAAFGSQGILVIGNESHGISFEIESLITRRVTILKAAPSGQGRAESLNASLATAIFCYEINRNRTITSS